MRIFTGSEGFYQVTWGHLDLAEVGVRQSVQDQVTFRLQRRWEREAECSWGE